MDIKDSERLIESFNKCPLKTVAIIVTFLLLVSLCWYLEGYFSEHGKRANVANVDPEIICHLAYPYKIENGKALKQIDSPELTITNAGPIKAVAFSADLKYYLYDKKQSIIIQESEFKLNINDHLIFTNELKPNDEIKKTIVGLLTNSDYMAIYRISSKFYRETDNKVYNHQDLFFGVGYEIFPDKDYTTNAEYPKIIQAIKTYNPPLGSKKIIMHTIDNKWYLKDIR